MDGPRENCRQRAETLQPQLPEADVARAWVFYADEQYEEAVRLAQGALDRESDCEGGYYLLARVLFAMGRFHDIVQMAETAVQMSGEDYNIYVPILNALGALGKTDLMRHWRLRRVQVLETHLRKVPEDVRARVMLASDHASLDRVDDALREVNLAVGFRPDDASMLYNAACVYCLLNKKSDALEALAKAHAAGLRHSDWAQRIRIWRWSTAIPSSKDSLSRLEELILVPPRIAHISDPASNSLIFPASNSLIFPASNSLILSVLITQTSRWS